MAPSTETITPNQLKRARTALWHQDGDALRTLDDARTWLDAAGLVPFYPHAQFAAAPQPSFAEAVLGRPETGWIPPVPGSERGEESFAAEVEDEDSSDEEADEDAFDEDEDSDEDEEDDEELDDDQDEDLDEADGKEDADEEEGEQELSPEASDAEIMLSDDDEVAEDEGDEIAEMDRVHAAGDPVPNDLRGDAATEAAEPVAPVQPVNGFTPAEKETVSRTLARMVAEGSAVPLNLLGSTTGEPDFICSSQAFSFVYTLRGDKTWKQEPAQTGSMRVSPLAVKVYEALKEKGPMAPHELANEVGQGVVDSAILRGLSELWAIQRVIPVPDPDGAPAKWELMSGRFVRHLKDGANAGQPTALSALLSLYLSQAVAASSDEMETFLSPLAARSRVREVVGGLAASRQLDSVVLEGKTLMFMPGALDTLPADIPADETNTSRPRSRYEDDDRRAMIDARAAEFGAPGAAGAAGAAAEGRSRYPVRKPAGARAEGERGGRPDGARPGGFGGPRREGGFSPQRRSGSSDGPRREGGFAGGRDDRERRPFVRRDDAATARPSNEFARPWEQDGGERKPFTPREGGERRPFAPRADNRSFGERKPSVPREGGERRPFTPRGDRPFTPREGGERKPFVPREGGERRPFAPRGDRPFTPREGGERKPFVPREGGERRPFTPRGDRPFTPREGGDRKPFAPRGDRPFTPRGDGERRPFVPREGGERRPFTPREGGDRKPFAPRGDRPFTPRSDGERRPFVPREGGDRKPFAPRGDRPFTPRGDGERRPFVPREGGDRKPFAPRGDRPFTFRGDGERRPFVPREGGDRKPFAPRGDRPFTPRGDGERRPFVPREGGDRKPFAPRKTFGADRGGAPGGFSRPNFSPARRGPGSGPGRGGAPKRRPE